MSRVARRGLLAGLILLLGAGVTRAQPDPWDAPRAREDARRVLEAIQEVMSSSERADAQPVVRALRDPSWMVRLVAAIRLEVLGLEPRVALQLRQSADPAQPPPAADWPPLRAAAEFAASCQPDEGPPPPVEQAEALRIVASLVTERLQSGPEPVDRKRQLAGSLITYAHVVEAPEDRAWLARRLLGLTDLEQALTDLKARETARAVGRDGAPVFEWYRANAPYLYWHPEERRFRLDLAAREARTPTDAFRKQRPWGAKEGPNAPAEELEHRGR